VESAVAGALTVLGHVAFAVVRPVTATLRQQEHLLLAPIGVGEVKCRASFDLLAIVGSKDAIDRAFVAPRKNRQQDPKRVIDRQGSPALHMASQRQGVGEAADVCVSDLVLGERYAAFLPADVLAWRTSTCSAQ